MFAQNFIEIKGRETLNPISLSDPGDPSSASFYAGLCLLNKKSKIVVVSFHSLEDRIVKFFFKNYSEDKKISRYLPSTKNENKIFEILNKKVIVPSTEEIKKNPPSRSAKLRYAVKIKDECNFEEFIENFKKLIDIENLQFDK